MIADCAPEPGLIAFVKTFGTTFGIVAAALAWLLNKFLGWCVWEGGRLIERYELMKAIRAEIGDNMRSEEYYADGAKGRAYVAELERMIPPDDPLVPYVAVDERNFVFEEVAKSARQLPFDVVESIIGYYSASRGFTRQLLDFRSDAFKAISRERQKAVLLDTFEEGARVQALAREAQNRIQLLINGYRALVIALIVAAAFGAWTAADTLWRPGIEFIAAISGAVEWASTCDVAPTNASRK